MTSPIIDFIEARLAEDEAAAREAAQAIGNGEWGHGNRQVRSARRTLVADTVVDRYIARHDPARVLLEVQAKRAILDDIVSAMNGMDLQIHSEWGIGPMDPADYESVALLQLLALPYSDHPDFDPNWSTT